ncbi:MAG: hypothetical protein M1838_004356 [Thelocarpon superellum]|nr:MAG: hypothetical protein M1838_004356 [Thelocarpon superellum]
MSELPTKAESQFTSELPRVPDPYWHHGIMNYSSCPMLSQAEYNALEYTGPVPDELITIRAPNDESFAGFVEQRSVLARAPFFRDFFESPHYLPHTRIALWLLDTNATVFGIALEFLLLGRERFEPPALTGLPLAHLVYLKIRLYFLGKRLGLVDLQEIAYDWLAMHDDEVTVREIIDLARVIYEHPEEQDDRMRGFLQKVVEKNLRALLNSAKWRKLMRDLRPGFATDMFELTAALLLEGDAGGEYPPLIPSSTRQDPPAVGPGEQMCAVAIRSFHPERFSELLVYRGDTLRKCEIDEENVTGTDERGLRGTVPRDYVKVYVETSGIATAAAPQDAASPSTSEEYGSLRGTAGPGLHHHRGNGAGAEVTLRPGHRRNKASWILGMDHIPDVFFDPPVTEATLANAAAGPVRRYSAVSYLSAPPCGPGGRGSIMSRLLSAAEQDQTNAEANNANANANANGHGQHKRKEEEREKKWTRYLPFKMPSASLSR